MIFTSTNHAYAVAEKGNIFLVLFFFLLRASLRLLAKLFQSFNYEQLAMDALFQAQFCRECYQKYFELRRK